MIGFQIFIPYTIQFPASSTQPSYCILSLRPRSQLVRCVLSSTLLRPPPSTLMECILMHPSLLVSDWILSCLNLAIYIYIYIPPLRLNISKRHSSYIKLENANWVCTCSSRGLRGPNINSASWHIPLCFSAILSMLVMVCFKFTILLQQLQLSHGDLTTYSKERNLFSSIASLGKNFLPITKLLENENWTSGI